MDGGAVVDFAKTRDVPGRGPEENSIHYQHVVVVVVVERLVTGDAMFPFWVSDIPITNGYLEVSHVQDSPGRL